MTEREIQALLDQNVPLSSLTRNTNQGSPFYTIKSSDLVDLCDTIFGCGKWTLDARDRVIEHTSHDKTSNPSSVSVLVSIVVRLELASGSYHEDVGYGKATEPNEQSAIEDATHWAQVNGFVRCARKFGNALGNCLTQQFVDEIESRFNPDINPTI